MSKIDPHHLALVEAVLFASSDPLTEKALANRLPDGADVKALLAELGDHYAGRGVNLIQAGKTWAFRTNSEIAAQLVKEAKVTRKPGRATVEVLAIIAYHQPVTRGEIEEIRGVSLSGGTMETLLEEGWIKPRGRRRTPGRPMTWGTTDSFLDHFGLENLNELPGIADLKAAGLLNSGPAIETYAVTGKVKAAGDTEEDPEEPEPAGELALTAESDDLAVDEETDENAPESSEEGVVVSLPNQGGAVAVLNTDDQGAESEARESGESSEDSWPQPKTGPDTAA